MKAKSKDLKAQGKGNKTRAADELTDSDLDAMYEAGTLGLANRTSLLHSMWLMCTLYFGRRTGKEVHNMRWGDQGEYLIFTSERQSKTRTGANPNDIRRKPRKFSIPEKTDRDPVACYKMYRENRPTSMLQTDSPFVLAINHGGKAGSPWYKNSAMGLNKLYSITNEMKDGAKLAQDKRITPYSMRKHLVQKLVDQGVSPNQIMEVSGHKNKNSITNYSHLKPDQQRKISHLLSNVQPSNVQPSPPASSTVTSASGVSTSDVTASMDITSNQLAHQSFLSSILSNNTITGNINICISPNAFGFSSNDQPLLSEAAMISRPTRLGSS